MKLGKRVKRLLGAPKRQHTRIKVGGFLAGYSTVKKLYDRMIKKSETAARELDLGVAGSTTKSFFPHKACWFFPSRVMWHLYSKEELKRMRAFEEKIVGLSTRLKQGRFLKEDAVWLRGEFVPFLRECQAGDLARVQRAFKFEKGVPIVEGEED